MITTLGNVKLILDIKSDSQDSKIEELISLVEKEFLRIRNKPFEIDEHGDPIYPNGSEVTAIRMIAFLLETKGLGGIIQSESISRYSVSYSGDMSFGYPKGVVDGIERYVRYL